MVALSGRLGCQRDEGRPARSATKQLCSVPKSLSRFTPPGVTSAPSLAVRPEGTGHLHGHGHPQNGPETLYGSLGRVFGVRPSFRELPHLCGADAAT